MIKIHKLGLGARERDAKTGELYDYIQAERYRQNFEEIQSLNEEMQELDVQEEEQHRRTWKKRGRLMRRQQRALGEIEVGVGSILEGRGHDGQDG